MMSEQVNDPAILAAQGADDLHPENLPELERTMGHGDMQDPRQQAMLRAEQQRLQQAQAQQQFTQRLMQRLNPRIGTPQDTNPQAARAAFMARMMMQMRPGSFR